MSPKLFSATLCLLGASFMHAGIIQTPRYCIIRTGKKMTLECSQNMNNYAMFWYRQDPGQGLRLLHYSGSTFSTAKGDAPEGYSATRDENEHFSLTLESASTNQTSMYLCASSEYTAWHSQLLTEQKGQSQCEGGHVCPSSVSMQRKSCPF
ncbi:T-cell receptor beta chain V region PHDS203 [Fukomys damarensis]|nr:T-cell receptor beta chain V region PHDS203 [Fukomys damarensis]